MRRGGRDPPLWGVLRALTGHFDPSTVFTIIADSRSFHLWQQELQVCENLLFVNVSRCGLSSLNVLASLTRLKYLDISHNNIVRLDQIHKLKALDTVKVFANEIKRFQAGGGEACPVCHLPEYRPRVLCLLHREKSLKGLNGARKDLCLNLRSLEEQHTTNSNNGCIINPPPARQRESPRAELSFDRPSLMQPMDASPIRVTRLRVLDGMRVHLPDWNEQAIKICSNVLRQEEGARRLRGAVAEICCASAFLPKEREDEPGDFSQYHRKIAGLEAALTNGRKALVDFQKLQELIT